MFEQMSIMNYKINNNILEKLFLKCVKLDDINRKTERLHKKNCMTKSCPKSHKNLSI